MSKPLSRQIVIDHAFELASLESVESVTLTRIASDLGVTQPALYRHIGGIHELLKALTLRARELFVEELRAASLGLAGKMAVRALAYAWRRGGLAYPSLLTLPWYVRIQGDRELEFSVEEVTEVIGTTLAALDLDAEERMHAASLVRIVLHGFNAMEAGSGLSPVHHDETFEQLITLLWTGLQGMQGVVRTGRRRDIDSDPNNVERVLGDGAWDHLGSGARTTGGLAKKTGGKRTSKLKINDIVETASRIADERGLAAVSLTRVARSLGVRQPALYRHVEGSEDLYRALALHAQRSLLARVTRAAVGRTRDDALSSVARAWRRYVHEHPGTYSSIGRVTVAGDPLLENSMLELDRALILALRGYSLTAVGSRHLAVCIYCGLHGFCLLEKDGAYPRPGYVDDNFDRLISMFLAGAGNLVTIESAAEDLRLYRKAGKRRIRGTPR